MEEPGRIKAYNYSQLPGTDFIRILELRPSTDKDAPLQGNLQIAQLGHDDYPYDAMSYTWGEPVFSQTLYIEFAQPGKGPAHKSEGLYPIGITPNLSELLRNIRHPLRTRRLWVDALCINQEDDVEKSNQIPLMFRIYQQASQVVIWLGDKIEDQEDMRLLNIFARRCLQYDEPTSMPQDDQQAAQEAVYRLIEIPWFSRLWVVQEAAVNTDVTMYCGAERMSLMRLFDIVVDIESLLNRPSARLQPLGVMGILWNIHARRRSGEIVPHPCDGCEPCLLVAMMVMFEGFGCADPRDRVYAISTLQTCVTIVPDYRLSPEQVYLDFARSMREHGQLAWVLREAAIRSRGKRTSNLPSWVPDLSLQPIRRPIFTTDPATDGKYSGERTYVKAGDDIEEDEAITFLNCYVFSHLGVRPDRGMSWIECWSEESQRTEISQFKTLRFDPHPMIATWRGDSFPDQSGSKHVKTWVRSTFELVWQQFSKRAATVSPAASEMLTWEHCTMTVASVLVADGAHMEALDRLSQKEWRQLSKHEDPRWCGNVDPNVQMFSTCLRELLDGTICPTKMCGIFIRLVEITMQGRCFFTSDLDEDPEYLRAPIACGIGPSHLQLGDQALLHLMPFWERAYLVRECGRTEEQSISCFELVGDCYLKEPIKMNDSNIATQMKYEGNLRDYGEINRTIVFK